LSDRGLVAGVVLLLIGLYILLSRRVGFSGPGPILLLIGSGFLILSALRRWRGPIAPGAILVGLGAGFLFQGPMESLLPRWATLVLGLGAGFLLAAALEKAAGRLRAPGPIVPGTILVGTALLAAVVERFDLTRLFRWIGVVWPWALVLAGVALVVLALARRKT
jgi:hypothetical protein